MRELRIDTLVVAGLCFKIRPDAGDYYTVTRIVRDNIYDVPASLEGSFVIDIGAHIGAFSALCASRGARVIGFEPEPGNFELLLENAQTTRCDYFPQAVAGAYNPDGVLQVYAGNQGCHSLKAGFNGLEFDHEEAVQINDIGVVMLGIPRVAILKIDCEGSEEEILPRMEELDLFRKVDQLAIEFHRAEFRDAWLPKLRALFPREKWITDDEWSFKR